MKTKLSLTQDQVLAVTPIIKKYTAALQEISKSFKVAQEDKDLNSQLKRLINNERQELSQVLSLAQLGQWNSLQHMRRHHQALKDGGTSGPSGPDFSGRDNHGSWRDQDRTAEEQQ